MDEKGTVKKEEWFDVIRAHRDCHRVLSMYMWEKVGDNGLFGSCPEYTILHPLELGCSYYCVWIFLENDVIKQNGSFLLTCFTVFELKYVKHVHKVSYVES